VTPVHPKEAELQGLPTIKTLAELSSPSTTAVSIVTPPKVRTFAFTPHILCQCSICVQVTLGLLESLTDATPAEKRVPYAWLQPDTYDAAVHSFIAEHHLEDRVILGGACVLVDGDDVRAAL
jgi:hypothetical protein